MKPDKDIVNNLSRKVNRQLELEAGRLCYNRIHKNKKAYDRKENKKFIKINLVDR